MALKEKRDRNLKQDTYINMAKKQENTLLEVYEQNLQEEAV